MEAWVLDNLQPPYDLECNLANIDAELRLSDEVSKVLECVQAIRKEYREVVGTSLSNLNTLKAYHGVLLLNAFQMLGFSTVVGHE